MPSHERQNPEKTIFFKSHVKVSFTKTYVALSLKRIGENKVERTTNAEIRQSILQQVKQAKL